MENANQKTIRPHVLMVPYPLQGHIIPFTHLALKLASKGFTITFVNTESNHHQITTTNPSNHGQDLFAGAKKSGLDIRYATISDGFPLDFDRSLNRDQFWEGTLHVFSAHVDDLLEKMSKTASPPVTCLISDTFYVWSSMVAKKHNLVNVSFWTEPALVLSLYYHLHLLKINGHFACNDKRDDPIEYIPGIKSIEPKDLMSYLQVTDIATVEHRIIAKAFVDVKRADFVICNTVHELEPSTIEALQENQPIYSIGPIFPSGFPKSTVSTSLWAESDCTSWLDSKPNGSVLYVSFGSFAHCAKEVVLEIAHGLSNSKINFIWVLRPDIVSSIENDILPSEFADETKHRGMVVPWCSQINVISHPAVGGFLTHCGWNSVLESIWCSVPLLCFPLYTDQFTNRKLVVDDWKIGINLCGGRRKNVTREEVASNVRLLMGEEVGGELRRNVKGVKLKLENALSDGGSSEISFGRFVEDVKAKVQDKRG